MASRRNNGSGSIYYETARKRWAGAVTIPTARNEPRKRARVADPLFCHCLRKLTEAAPVAANAPRKTPTDRWRERRDQLAAARAIATHTPQEWRAIVLRANGKCEYCGTPTPGPVRVKEHRVPLLRGGSDGADNLAYACAQCNRIKGTMTDVEFIEWRRRHG